MLIDSENRGCAYGLPSQSHSIGSPVAYLRILSVDLIFSVVRGLSSYCTKYMLFNIIWTVSVLVLRYSPDCVQYLVSDRLSKRLAADT